MAVTLLFLQLKKQQLTLALFSLMLIFSTASLAQGNSPMYLNVGVHSYALKGYSSHRHFDICNNLPALKDDNTDRPLSGIIIICQAFAEMQTPLFINVIPEPNYLRGIRMVEEGFIDTLSNAVWSSDINNALVNATIEIIKHGEFTKGLYVHEGHKLLQQKGKSFPMVLTQYTGLTVKSWHYDRDIIAQLTDYHVETAKVNTVFDLLAAGNADFTLMDFPSGRQLSIRNSAGIVLKPIKGVKALVPDARRFIISKNSDVSADIYFILNEGLKRLIKKGRVKQIYRNTGFFNAQTKHWRILNSDH